MKEKMMKKGSFANLPQKEIIKKYPQYPAMKMNDRYADSMEGIDKIAKENEKKLKRAK